MVSSRQREDLDRLPGLVWAALTRYIIVVELLKRKLSHSVSQFLLSYPSLHILSIVLNFFLV